MVAAAAIRPAMAIHSKSRRVLVLACGNTHRGDDGIGWEIAAAIAKNPPCGNIEIIRTHQWLPEHAALISEADVVVFLDCSVAALPGTVSSIEIEPAQELPQIFTHHLDPAALFTLAQRLYHRLPSKAVAITIGGIVFEHSARLSNPVAAAIPLAIKVVRKILTGKRVPLLP